MTLLEEADIRIAELEEVRRSYIRDVIRLRAHNERLIKALEAYVQHTEEGSELLPCCELILKQARAALNQTQGE